MSHVTKIASVPIKDEKALIAACNKLKREGTNCTLIDNRNKSPKVAPRLYSQAQMSAHKNCDFVLQLHDACFDIGFEKTAAGYETITDFYRRPNTLGVEQVLGNGYQEGSDPNLIKLGKLYQNYSYYAAYNSAVEQGYNVTESTDADGNMHLILTNR